MGTKGVCIFMMPGKCHTIKPSPQPQSLQGGREAQVRKLPLVPRRALHGVSRHCSLGASVCGTLASHWELQPFPAPLALRSLLYRPPEYLRQEVQTASELCYSASFPLTSALDAW